MLPQLHFLGWHKPWTDLFTGWLLQEPARLRQRLVVVPTRESGRRLRELLAVRAAPGGQGGILGPRIATPNDFFRAEQPMPEAVRWAGWRHALSTATDQEVSAVFPLGVGEKAEAWRQAVARRIDRARDLVADSTLDFAAVAEKIPAEGERWRQLAALEQRAAAQWRAWGFEDPVAAKKRRAMNPVLPPGVVEIVVAGVPDPTPLARVAWEALASRGTLITVLVGAPSERRQQFDAWGCPVAAEWSDRSRLPTPLPTRNLVVADATTLARETVKCCLGHRNDQVAVGACDPSCLPALGREFREAGWLTFNPEGSERAVDGWPALLRDLAAGVRTPDDYQSLARLARHPAFAARWPDCGDVRRTLRTLDHWENEAAVASTRLALAQLAASQHRDERAAGDYLARVAGVVTELKADVTAAALQDLLAAAPEELRQRVETEISVWPLLAASGLSLELRLTWLAASVAALKEKAAPKDAVLALQGWLELPFDPAPHLVLAGLHEGCVPEAPPSDPLLSEQAREILGIRARRSRHARDAFLYTAMVEGRKTTGSVAVLTSMFDGAGEPRNPSRLLLQATVEELPGRVERFIKEEPDVPTAPTPPARSGQWKLEWHDDLPRHRPLTHLSPSALRGYLTCPTRYYFERVMGWAKHEPFDGELSGAGFGNLIHQVFKQWGNDPVARDTGDAARIRDSWLQLLAEQAHLAFGPEIPPQLQLQLFSAEERLGAFAVAQAAAYADGWRVEAVELELKSALELEGIPVHVRIDRVDRHVDGRLRVVDYKTADSGEGPAATHLAEWTTAHRPRPLGPLCPIQGKKSVALRGWIDLQLPLYAAAAKAHFGRSEYPECWYALLPKSVTDAKFQPFDALQGEGVMANALEWAKQAAAGIRDGRFWPPAPQVKYDAFELIAPEGLEAALGPAWQKFLSPQSP